MFDLGTSFVGSVARDPHELAIIDGSVRLTYRQWYEKISSLVQGLDQIGLRPGDHLVSALQNSWEAATLHWACQFAGVVITPINWRAKSDEVSFCLNDSEARAIAFQDVSAESVELSDVARNVAQIGVGITTTDRPPRSGPVGMLV